MPELSIEDREALAEITRSFRREIADSTNDLRKDIALIAQRTSRGPDAVAFERTALNTNFNANFNRPTVALSADTNFKTWLSQPRTRHSHFAGEFRFAVTKAATPITGVGIPQPYPMIRGPQQPALRLGMAVPRVPMTAGSGVTFTREESFVPGATFVAEGALKPQTGLTFGNHTVNFQTLATISKLSLQAIADTPDLVPWVERRLSYSVLLTEEDYLLNDPAGLLALAQPISAAYAPTGGTTLDVVGAAVAELEAMGYSPDAIVLSGPDAARTRLLKTTFGSYLWASPDSEIGTSSMWSVPVIISPKIAPGTVLVAALAESCLLFDRQSLIVEIAFQNEDDFIRNLCTLRAEERVALAVLVPAALIKGVVTSTATSAANEPQPAHPAHANAVKK